MRPVGHTPDRFACGVDIVGPSNLQTLLDTMGDDFEGSSIQIPEGARFVPGLPDPRAE